MFDYDIPTRKMIYYNDGHNFGIINKNTIKLDVNNRSEIDDKIMIFLSKIIEKIYFNDNNYLNVERNVLSEYKDEIDQLINECIELLEGNNPSSEEILSILEKLADINPILLYCLDTLDSDNIIDVVEEYLGNIFDVLEFNTNNEIVIKLPIPNNDEYGLIGNLGDYIKKFRNKHIGGVKKKYINLKNHGKRLIRYYKKEILYFYEKKKLN